MKYYIADTHFGHENIIKLCGRPFADAEEMDRVITGNWNSVVNDGDDPTLCDPIEGSPPGSPIPGILQGVSISFFFK